MRSLIINKPEDPVKFLIDKLEKPESKYNTRTDTDLSRQGQLACVCLGLAKMKALGVFESIGFAIVQKVARHHPPHLHLTKRFDFYSNSYRACGPTRQQEKGNCSRSLRSLQRGR